MNRAYFSAAEQYALDSYDIPPMRADFADRVVQRALAGSAPVTPINRHAAGRRFRTPWARAGRRVGAFVAFGFISAAAAALGVFGQPERIPVVGELFAQAFGGQAADTVRTAAQSDGARETAIAEAGSATVSDQAIDRPGLQDLPVMPVAAQPANIPEPSPVNRKRPTRHPVEAPERTRRVELPQPVRMRRPGASGSERIERLTERVAEVRDHPVTREQVDDSIIERRERLTEIAPQQASVAPVADQVEIANPEITAEPRPARLQDRAATERARAQLRKRREARRAAKPKPRDVARQRRALRKRRR